MAVQAQGIMPGLLRILSQGSVLAAPIAPKCHTHGVLCSGLSFGIPVSLQAGVAVVAGRCYVTAVPSQGRGW